MTDALAGLRRFFSELKRRKVYRVAAVYAAVAFVLVEAADLVFPALNIPGWANSLVVVLALFGFPLALVLAWAFEVTPEGVRRTEPAGGPVYAGATETGAARVERPDAAVEGAGGPSGRDPGLKALVGLGLLAAAAAGGWYLLGTGEPEVTDRSLAVLPFRATGGEESARFSEGLHDGLLTRLTDLSALTVKSRTSTGGYGETEKTVPEIARELDVAWIVEGGVRQAGDRIRVSATLIDAREDDRRWARDYERELTVDNVFAIESDLARRIARSLEAELSAREEERVERQPTDDLEAYQLYVEGRGEMERRTEEGLRRGIALFREAIARDSGYALAWTGLADAYGLLANYGFAPPDSVYPGALEAARRALELDPEMGEAHASLGYLYQEARQDGPAALRELRRAVELKPGYARAHHWLGLLLGALGRLEESVEPLERAVELDPLSPVAHVALALAYSYLDRLEEALRESRRSGELGFAGGTEYTGRVLSKMGRQEEAIATFRRVLEEDSPGPWVALWTRAWLAVALRRTGDTAGARELQGRIEEKGRYPFAAAIVHAGLGEPDEALADLERAVVDLANAEVLALRYSPVFDPLREDARFEALIRDVNRRWGLNPDGSFPGKGASGSAAATDYERAGEVEVESGAETRG